MRKEERREGTLWTGCKINKLIHLFKKEQGINVAVSMPRKKQK